MFEAILYNFSCADLKRSAQIPALLLIMPPLETQSPFCEEAQVDMWRGPHGKLSLLADSPY